MEFRPVTLARQTWPRTDLVVRACLSIGLSLIPVGTSTAQPVFSANLAADRLQQLATFLSKEADLATAASTKLNDPKVKDATALAWRWGPTPTTPQPKQKDAGAQKALNQFSATAVGERSSSYRNYSEHLRTVAEKVRNSTNHDAIVQIDSLYVPLGVRELLNKSLLGTPPSVAVSIRVDQSKAPGHGRFSLPREAESLGFSESSSLVPFVLGRGAGTSVDFPAVAALMYDDGAGFRTYCTGTLVHARAVITAAHCFCDVRAKGGDFLRTSKECRAGSYFRGADRIAALNGSNHAVFFQHSGLVQIEQVLLPDGYSWPESDIALVLLEGSIDSIAPIELNNVSSLPPQTKGVIVGFGVHGPLDAHGTPQGGAPVMRSEGLKNYAFISTDQCASVQAAMKLICWTYGVGPNAELFGSTCHGDSGGPLFVGVDGNWRLAGVTSGGATCLPGDRPVDVDIFSHLPWIRSAIVGLSTPSAQIPKLSPIRNIGRFPFSASYRKFHEVSEQWMSRFRVPAGTSRLTVALNTTNQMLSSSFKLLTPQGEEACADGDWHSVIQCVISSPVEGFWEFVVVGSHPQEFQIVATSF